MLIEREAELKTLGKALTLALEGRGQIVLITGEAGMGKSSVLAEFRRKASREYPDMRWFLGGCEALFTPRTLGPLHDMAYDLGPDVVEALENEAGQAALFGKVLSALDQPKPAVMVCEDLHWADYATLDLIKFLSRRLNFLPVLLIITFRDNEVGLTHPLMQVLGDLPGRHTERIQLKPFTSNGIKALGDMAERDVEQIFGITDGNPFYVTELLAAQPEEGFVPASVKDAVSLRLAQLKPEERSLLEKMSILPNASRYEFLDAYLGEEGSEGVASCIARGLLVDDGQTIRFRHEIARLATQEKLAPARQRQYHEHSLKVLIEAGARIPLDAIVYHASVAQDYRRVLEYAPQAARVAAQAGAHREAAAHYHTALRFVSYAEPNQAAELYESWAYESVLADNVGDDVIEARRHAITLYRALNRPDKVGNNLRHLSRLHWYRGESAEATWVADQAIAELEAVPPSSERAMAYSMRSQLFMLKDHMAEAIAWAQRALELEKEYPDEEIRVHAFNNIGTALAFRADREGVRYLEESLRLALKGGYHEHAARAYNNLAEFGLEFREFDLAEKVLNDGLAFDSEHDLDAWTHYLSGRLAMLRLDQGRLHDATRIAEGVMKLVNLSLISRLPARLVLSRAKMRLGDDDADILMRSALSDAISTDELQHIFPARLTLIEWHWLNDAPVWASEHLEGLMAHSMKERHPWNIGMRQLWCRRLGRAVDEALLDKMPEPIALELTGRFDAAAECWTRLGLPYEAGLVLLQKGDEAGIRAAMDIFIRLNARTAMDKTQRLARKAGLEDMQQSKRRGPYKASRTHPLGLTAKEQLVLRHLREGLSNREISEEINRSQRTVEHHVSSILGKLNVNNRMAAILRIEREPWLLGDEA